MRNISQPLINAAHAPVAEPTAKMEIVNHPFMLGSPMAFESFATMSGSGPLNGVSLADGTIIIIHLTSGYKRITTPETTTEWEGSWTTYPASGKPSNFEALAVSASGTNVQIFGRNTSTGAISVCSSSDSGQSFGAWSSVGTPTEANEEVVACAEYNALFLRHYSSTGGVALTAYTYSASWTEYHTKTGLVDEFPSVTKIGVVDIGNSYLIYFSAKYPTTITVNEGVMVVEFVDGSFGQPEPALLDMAQEYTRYDYLRSVSSLADRSVLTTSTFRSGIDSSETLESIVDDFSSYHGRKYLPVADMEQDETWVTKWGGMGWETPDNLEGSRTLKLTTPYSGGLYIGDAIRLNLNANLEQSGLFDGEDFLCIPVKGSGAPTLYIRLSTGFTNYYEYSAGTVGSSWTFLYPKKSDFAPTGSPSWSNITELVLQAVGDNAADYVLADYCRLEKADPDDIASPNPTGDKWNFSPSSGEWAVVTDQARADQGRHASSLALLDAAGGECIATYNYTPTTERYVATAAVKVFDISNGQVGLWFDSQNITSGSETGYAFYIDTSSDNVELERYDGGTAASLASGTFPTSLYPGSEYYLAVARAGSRIRCFASASMDTLFDGLILSAEDNTYSNGPVGFISIDSLARFNEFTLDVYTSETSIETNTLSFTSGRNVSTPTLYDSNPPRDVLIGGRYGFDISDSGGVIYRSDKQLDAVAATVTSDVLSGTLSYPYESSSALRCDVSNLDGTYTDHATLRRGAGLRYSLGFYTPEGVQYANMGLFRINTESEVFTPEKLSMTISCIDGNWLLKNWKSQSVHLYQSQNKLYLDFLREEDSAYIVDVGVAPFTLAGGELRAYSETHECIALTGEEFNGCVAECSIRIQTNTNTPSGRGGLILAADDDFKNGYFVHVDWTFGGVQIWKKVDDVDTALAETATLNPLFAGASVWLRVLHHNNTIYAWTSEDGADWSYATSYTDSDAPFLHGHTGIKAINVGGEYTAIQRLNVASLKVDKTIDESMRFVATKAGILDFESEYQFKDDFSDGLLASKWDYNGTIDNVTVAGGEMEVSQNSATYGYMASQLSVKNGVFDVVARTTAGGRVVLVYRLDSDLLNGYQVSVQVGSMGTCHVVWQSIVGGVTSTLYDCYPRCDIPAGIDLPYRLSVDNEFVALWVGGYPILVGKDNTNIDAGYFGVGAYSTPSTYFSSINSVYADALVDSLTVNVKDNAETICRSLAKIGGVWYYIEEDAKMRIASMKPGSGLADSILGGTPLQFEDQLFQANVGEDDQQWITHLRAVGKDGISIDFYDKSDTGIDDLGYRFDVLEVSEVTRLDDLIDLARAEVELRKTSIMSRTLTGQGQVACQRGDRINVKVYNIPGDVSSGYAVDGDFVIRAISNITYKRTPEPDLTMTMEVEDAT